MDERLYRRLVLVCGPHRKVKRGAWVAEAISEKLTRERRRSA